MTRTSSDTFAAIGRSEDQGFEQLGGPHCSVILGGPAGQLFCASRQLRLPEGPASSQAERAWPEQTPRKPDTHLRPVRASGVLAHVA